MGLFHLAAELDNASKAGVRRMRRFQHYLEAEMGRALFEEAQHVAETAELNTWEVFTNPTGELASQIKPVLLDPYTAAVDFAAPYAARREFGYSGQVDALGRFYPYDPAHPYAIPALEEHQAAIEQAMWRALNNTILDLITGPLPA